MAADIPISIIPEPESPKRAVFLGTSLVDLAAFPPEARQKAGKDIGDLQAGRMPPDWKPMPTVGAGTGEVRVQGKRAFRVFFVARFHEAIYILHAFEKKSQATARRDIELGRTRYQALVRARAEDRHGVDGPR
jgi:phage-related protein